jgi:hypothetical protein
MDIYLLLAQDPVEAADKAVGILERIQQGGALLVTLVMLLVTGGLAYWQLRRNAALQEQNAKLEREWREADGKVATERRSENMSLLREQLARDKEAQEVQAAAAEAVEGLANAVRDLTARIERLDTRVETVARDVHPRGRG